MKALQTSFNCLLLEHASHPEWSTLVSTIPRLVNAAIAKSTRSKYERAWSRWESFASTRDEVTARPADHFHIAIYFNYLLTVTGKRGAIIDAMYGIRWGHISAGYISPTDHPFVKICYEGALRLSNYSGLKKKDPISPCMLHRIIDTYDGDGSLLTMRFLTLCLLGFSGFMRTEELLDIKIHDIQFYESHLTISIPKAKNDQLREGNVIYISALGSRYCPVSFVAGFIVAAKLCRTSYLFCKLAKTKHGHKAHGFKKLSYSTMRRIFLNFTKPLFPAMNLCLHGLRAGGASAAAENNVSDRMISKHGRWSSEKARDGYIRDNIKHRLEVSRKLGL